MIHFTIPMQKVQFLLPAVCTGLLLMGSLLFAYMAARFRTRLDVAMLLLSFFGFMFVATETGILTVSLWLMDPTIGMQFQRMEQIAAAGFLIAVPAYIYANLTLTPGWQKINRLLPFIGAGIALVMTFIAFAFPDLWVSQTVHDVKWQWEQGSYGRGMAGIVYVIRDALLGPLIIYSLVCFIADMYQHRDTIKYQVSPLIGLLIAIYSAIEDIAFVYTQTHYDPFQTFHYSRFTLGISLFIIFAMGSAVRRFFDLAQQVEQARETARREADKNMQQNSYIRNVLQSNSHELVSSTESLSRTIEQFTENSQEQAAATEEVTAAIEQVMAGADNVAQNAEDQFVNLEVLSRTMDELSGIIVSMGTLVSDALGMIGQISANAQSGEQSLRIMNESMANIRKSSTEITGIVQIINDISDRINLLSLNASIEAARAGDAGRGFAVVAEEVSKLADQTASSIKNIDTLIRTNENDIISGIRNIAAAVEKIDSVIADIDGIVRKITEISGHMGRQTSSNKLVNENSQKVQMMSEQIKSAMIEQKTAIAEISRTVGSINELSQGNTMQIFQITDATKALVDRVSELNKEIDEFGS